MNGLQLADAFLEIGLHLTFLKLFLSTGLRKNTLARIQSKSWKLREKFNKAGDLSLQL